MSLPALLHHFAPPRDSPGFDADIRRRCSNLMSTFFGKVPYGWQLECLVHLAKMHFEILQSGAILVVRPTGGGKSAVRDLHVLLHRGITLTVVPLLALGADQCKKTQETNGAIHSIHLDEFKTASGISTIVSSLPFRYLRLHK